MSEFDLGVNAGIDIYSAAVLLFLGFALHRQTVEKIEYPRRHRLFLCIVGCLGVLLLADFLSRMDGRPGVMVPLSRVGNFVLFFLNPVPSYLWYLYVSDQAGAEPHERKGNFAVQTALFALNTVLLVVSQFNGCLYYFDAGNVYHRGALFALPCVVMFGMSLLGELNVIHYRRRFDRRYFLAMLFFPVIPLAASLLQMLFYGVAYALNSTAYALMIVFFYVQSHNMDTDYLTGVYNRRKLDGHMRQQIQNSSEKNTFAAILLDIDQFKLINDMFGHDVGDAALVDAVEIIKGSLREDTFIGRYGGDEFCVILSVARESDVQRIMDRINRSAELFNRSAGRPYELHFSMGGTVYPPSSRMDIREFQKCIDRLMYENKRDAAFRTDLGTDERRQSGQKKK